MFLRSVPCYSCLAIPIIQLGEMGNGGKVKRNEPEGPKRMISHDEGWFKIDEVAKKKTSRTDRVTIRMQKE